MPTAAVMGGSAIYGAYQAHKASSKADALTANQTALGKTQAAQSQSLFKQGMPQLQQAGNYFSTLAKGDRAATTQALAPAVANINDVYGGTARTLSRFLRGPERDTQMAEAERERAGKIGSLFRDAPGEANAQLATMGGSEVSAGMGGASSAAGIFSNAAQTNNQNETQSRQAGSDFGGLLFDLLKNYAGKQASTNLFSRATTPSTTSFMPG